MVFFKLSDDPELYELLADGIKKSIKNFTTDEILTILVNFSHSLSTETSSLFEIVNGEFVYRLDTNYNPDIKDLYIKMDDFPKILNTLLDHK